MENRRNTEQKKIVMDALMNADHPTASELCDRIHTDHPKLSRATVFRVLSQFAEDGRIRKLEFLNSDTRFDWCTRPHAHCRCVNCGKIADVYDDELEKMLTQKERNGYDVYLTQVEFSGLCPECKKKNN